MQKFSLRKLLRLIPQARHAQHVGHLAVHGHVLGGKRVAPVPGVAAVHLGGVPLVAAVAVEHLFHLYLSTRQKLLQHKVL